MLASILAAFSSSAPDDGVQQRPPRYAGEDTTPTSHREILGWYSYGIAAEVFAVCGVGKLTAPLVILECFLVATSAETNSTQSRVISTVDPRTARSREWHSTKQPFALLGSPGARKQGR